MLDTFRPHEDFGYPINGIQEELSIHDITYRTNSKVKTNRDMLDNTTL